MKEISEDYECCNDKYLIEQDKASGRVIITTCANCGLIFNSRKTSLHVPPEKGNPDE